MKATCSFETSETTGTAMPSVTCQKTRTFKSVMFGRNCHHTLIVRHLSVFPPFHGHSPDVQASYIINREGVVIANSCINLRASFLKPSDCWFLLVVCPNPDRYRSGGASLSDEKAEKVTAEVLGTEFRTVYFLKFVKIDVRNLRTSVITHFIPLFRYYVSGSDESG
jgi:hypothetical protein